MRYGETDRMGFAYYGNYAEYFEVARVEALRELGMNYKDMEDSGTILPVYTFSVKYFKPAHYDDLIQIETVVTEIRKAQFTLAYQVKRDSQTLVTATTRHAATTLAGKPIRIPDLLLTALKKPFANIN